MLEEKSKFLRLVADKVLDLRDIEECRSIVVDYRRDILRGYKILEDSVPIKDGLLKLKKKLNAENLSDTEKQILCNQADGLEKLDEDCAESLRIMKTEVVEFSLCALSVAQSRSSGRRSSTKMNEMP